MFAAIAFSELENESGLISKAVLVAVARGEIVNKSCQKIISFDGPDCQVRGNLEVDAPTNHHIKAPIAGRAENTRRTILMDILVKICMRAPDEPLKKRLETPDTDLYRRPDVRGPQVCIRCPGATRWTPYAPGRKGKVDVLAGISLKFRLDPEKPGKIKHRSSASTV